MMATTAEPRDPDSTAGSLEAEPPPNYEAARAELRDIVAALESGGQPLEESLRLWQRGEELANICQRWLDSARERLEAAVTAADAQRNEPAS